MECTFQKCEDATRGCVSGTVNAILRPKAWGANFREPGEAARPRQPAEVN